MNTTIIILFICNISLGVLAYVLYSQLRKLKELQDLQAKETKDQYYEIVHELRAPLTAVKDAAIMLNDMPGKLNAEDQSKMLHLIKNECLRLLEQVSSFLDASKVMTNKVAIQKVPSDLKNLLSEKIMMYSPQAKSAGLEIKSDIDPQMPLILYDPKYMSQVINNLISNSLKYTPAGGTITVSAKTTDNTVFVSVFDNGLGVTDEKKKELFSKFASINSKTSSVASSGLGLYVAKGIIEAHNGKVTVETHEGRGYKVSFTLPLQSLPTSLSTQQSST